MLVLYNDNVCWLLVIALVCLGSWLCDTSALYRCAAGLGDICEVLLLLGELLQEEGEDLFVACVVCIVLCVLFVLQCCYAHCSNYDL